MPASLRSLAHLCLGLCAALAFLYLFTFSNHSTEHRTPRTVQQGGPRTSGPSEQELEATAKICDALRELRALAVGSDAAGQAARSPFELLGLDPGVAPFKPTLSSGSLGPKVQSQIEQIVTDAAVEVREKLWPRLLDDENVANPSHTAASIKQHVLATYVVTAMLVDEHARLMYLSRVHPKLRKWDEAVKAVDRLCGKLYETPWNF